MSRNIILCEGSTDKILIGHYLSHSAGWTAQTIKAPPFTDQSIRWFVQENNILGIWQVNGTNFIPAIETIAKREMLEHLIDKVLVITDHDDESAETERPMKIYRALCSGLRVKPSEESITPSKWYPVRFCNYFGESDVNFCYVFRYE